MNHLDRRDGGASTARLSAAEQDRIHREQRQAAALRVLTARGDLDIAEILGLVEPTTPPARRRNVRGEVR